MSKLKKQETERKQFKKLTFGIIKPPSFATLL